MSAVIVKQRRDGWGNYRLYIVSDHGAQVSKLTGKKTVTMEDLKALAALGLEVRFLETVEVVGDAVELMG